MCLSLEIANAFTFYAFELAIASCTPLVPHFWLGGRAGTDN